MEDGLKDYLELAQEIMNPSCRRQTEVEALVKRAVEKVTLQEAGGIPQQDGSKRLRCRLVGDQVEVFCVGKWRPVANARKLPLTKRAFQQARRTLEINHVLQPGEELTLLYE